MANSDAVDARAIAYGQCMGGCLYTIIIGPYDAGAFQAFCAYLLRCTGA